MKKRSVLLVSVFLNVILLALALMEESRGHAIRSALVRRGIIEQKLESRGDYWCIQSWTTSLAELRLDCDVAFFGNSITRGSDFQEYFPDLKICNLGYSGDNLPRMQGRISMLKAVHPKKIFVMAGTNDLFHFKVEDYTRRYRTLLSTIRDSIPDAQIYIESVLPMNHKLKKSAPACEKIESANRAIHNIAGDYDATFIDLYSLYADKDGNLPVEMTPDGVHLLPAHYDRWAEAIRPYVY